MRGSRVARRYARAMIGLSEDHAQLEAWAVELERLARAVEMPEFQMRLASPELSLATRVEVLGRIAERLELSYPIRSLMTVVARHGRIFDLPAVAESYRDQLDILFGRTRAALTFAREPGPDDTQAVIAGLERLARKTIIPTIKVDEALLGGVVAELEGKIYDGSLATRLSEAEHRLLG